MKKWFILICATAAFIAGCDKGGGVPDDGSGGGAGGGGPHVINFQDSTPPVLEVYTPVSNQVFSSGSAINVTGKVSDADGLYQGRIRITNDANGEILKEQFYEIHATLQYNFNISYTVGVTTASNYTVSVMFEDHGLNTTSQSVKIKANP